MRGRVFPYLALAGVLSAGQGAAEGLGQPAELPPPEYRGQQYVDSAGCLFLRAGPAEQTVWVPRVTRGGAPMCDHPPSGQRVPVSGETEDAGADQ